MQQISFYPRFFVFYNNQIAILSVSIGFHTFNCKSFAVLLDLQVDIFENAFRKIKEATGVSDVNEVIQKIVSQESTTENLIAVTRENQGKIEALNQLRKQIKTHCEELKYSGVGGGQHRKMVTLDVGLILF